MSTLEQQICEIISEVTQIPQEKLTRDTHLTHDLGLDSLSALTVVAALEHRYGLTFPDYEPYPHTPRQIASLMARLQDRSESPDYSQNDVASTL